MVRLLKLFLRFIRYYFKAKTKYNVHSPFVYEFLENVLEDERMFYAFDELEHLRKLILRDHSTIQITDYGAGSQVTRKKERSLASLAKYSATMPFFCRILFRAIHYYKPTTLLELGTSLGISSLYQAAAASKNSKFITIEGCGEISQHARQNFELLGVKNIALLTGRFKDQLPKALLELEQLDYLFIDGNHRHDPTLEYFEQCLEYAHGHSIFVLDDIHWSTEMEAAWEKVKGHPKVKMTIDLFFCGVVFFRKEQRQKEHFVLIKASWKPWKRGFLSLLTGV